MWLGQSKLAIFIVAAISECLIYAEAKYCAFEIHGEPKYYVCPRTEYCCNFGCCVSPGFQIYHLWYYWLLVIIMFLVCSGGGWWYRYWLQGRYRPSTSAIPPRTSNSRAQNAMRGPTCRAQQARVTYNPARNTVLLHRMWKGPQRNTTPPAYNGAAASSAQFQNTNVVLNENNCPYYELYGPPPSYETVIAQTRGKIMSPTQLENTRTSAQGSLSMQNQNVAHCYSHNSYGSLPTRIHMDNNLGERRNSCGSNLEEPEDNCQSIGFNNFAQKCDAQQQLRLGGSDNPLDNFYQESTASGTRQNGVPHNILKMLPLCVPENRQEQRGEGAVNSKSTSEPSAMNGGNNNQSAACASDEFKQGVTANRGIEDIENVREPGEMKLNDPDIEITRREELGDENHSRIPKMFMYSKGDACADGFGAKYQRAMSSSLKGRPGTSHMGEFRNIYCNVHRHKESRATEESSSSSVAATAAATCSRNKKLNSNSTTTNKTANCEECIAQKDVINSEQNPSNNVILLPSPNIPNVQINHSLPPIINIIENYQHYPPTTSSHAQRSIISTNFESECKLGRSKSLD